MPIDVRNLNTVWASVIAETLSRVGLTTAVICPGSRSAPLAIAFASHPQIEAIPVLDERSAAFFALGLARQSHQPVALVCTSGTAGANFYPAIIEATESRVPILILTADRPPELRACNAGQAIDQQKLYGTYPNWQTELALPEADLARLQYLRQTMIHAWERSLYPVPGTVHLNCPFRDPLAPTPHPANSPSAIALQTLLTQIPPTFFDFISPLTPPSPPHPLTPSPRRPSLPCHPSGLIIAGPAQPIDPEHYCQTIAHIAKTWHYPVLAEGLSPLRNYAHLNPYLITTYDAILRHSSPATQLIPNHVIRIGEMPTSKYLRLWLEDHQPPQWVIDPDGRNLDPLHGPTIHWRMSLDQLAAIVSSQPQMCCAYLDQWLAAEQQVRTAIDRRLHQTPALFEGKAAWLMAQILPPETPIFLCSGMPVRDVEFFWPPNQSRIQPYFNRGANGIDGSLSTALGMAHRQTPSVMLTGDLALLHDTNGFLLQSHFNGHLTIVLINNNGGGIFEMLPIAQFEPPFEEFFATPQAVDFGLLCQTYGVKYECITHWEQLCDRLNPLPTEGIRLLEIRTDRKTDAIWRQNNLGQCGMAADRL